jgi:hypothetical protein
MTDFEDRLRAAMASSVAGEYPPADLVARVRRRHRRHNIRLGVAWAAAAVAVAAVIPADRRNEPIRPALLCRPGGGAAGAVLRLYRPDLRRPAGELAPGRRARRAAVDHQRGHRC